MRGWLAHGSLQFHLDHNGHKCAYIKPQSLRFQQIHSKPLRFPTNSFKMSRRNQNSRMLELINQSCEDSDEEHDWDSGSQEEEDDPNDDEWLDGFLEDEEFSDWDPSGEFVVSIICYNLKHMVA